MKKVIAAAAGLMLVGTMVGSASADVSFGGDARARGYYQQNKDFGQTTVDEETGAVTRNNEQQNFINSRVRIQARATAPGGAYAVGRALYGAATWDGGNSGTADIGADKAYIGVPMGMTLLQAGRLPTDLLRSTSFFEQDITRDGLQFDVMATDMATIGLWYFIAYEASANGDLVDDNDVSDYGIYADLKFGGDWGTRMGTVVSNSPAPAVRLRSLVLLRLTTGVKATPVGVLSPALVCSSAPLVWPWKLVSPIKVS